MRAVQKVRFHAKIFMISYRYFDVVEIFILNDFQLKIRLLMAKLNRRKQIQTVTMNHHQVYRNVFPCKLKSNRKRRLTSSIFFTRNRLFATWPLSSSPPPSSSSSLHSFSFRRGQNSSNMKTGGPSNYCIPGRGNFSPHGNKLCFFCSNNDGVTKKKEIDVNPKQNTHDQHQRTVWGQLKSVPNIITLSRLASTPLLCYWIVNDEPNIAFVGCIVAGISDVLDGYIAKNHGGGTVLGTYLDPFADKFFINSLAISLWYSGILPTPVMVLWATKDFLLLGGMGWYLYQEQRTINFFSNSIHTKPLTVTPSLLGKANTVLQFATLAIGILTPVVPPEYLQPFVLQSLCWVTGTSSIVTTLSYAAGGKGFKYTSKKT